MDFGPAAVRIDAGFPRRTCPEHGIVTAAVPWAKPGSRVTFDFAFSATWRVGSGLNKKKVAELLRIDRDTVGRLVDLVWHEREPDVKKLFDGLVRIGIGETRCRKGRSYITIVVNHDTNTVVWAHKGHGKEVLELFFNELSSEQRESFLVVTGDGARRITDSMREHSPNADRCVDPFHVVERANDALDSVRLDSWRRARIALLDLQRKARTAKKAKAEEPEGLREEIRNAEKAVKELKDSKCALGKNEKNLTDRQRERLSMIQSEDGPLARGHRLKERGKGGVHAQGWRPCRNAPRQKAERANKLGGSNELMRREPTHSHAG